MKCVPLFVPVLTAVQILALKQGKSPICVCSWKYNLALGQETVATRFIDLGLANLRNVQDSVAPPRSYVDSRSQAFSDSWAWLCKST